MERLYHFELHIFTVHGQRFAESFEFVFFMTVLSILNNHCSDSADPEHLWLIGTQYFRNVGKIRDLALDLLSG